MTLAIIPARGGSKRIPGKNLRSFAGRPIMAYSIEAARASGLFDRILVSTDSDEIADLARDLGAEVPFRRPANLADDFATTAAVLAHALEQLGGAGAARHACCIYATAPFLEPRFLREGYELIRGRGALSVVPVATFPSPVHRALTIGADGRLAMLWPENRDRRSNDLPAAWRDAGQFYWVDVTRFLDERVLFGADTLALPLPRRIVHDIDTPEDWEVAELVHRALRAETPA